MKKIISLLTAGLLIVFLSVGVLADDLPTDESDTEETGRTVVSVDNGNGHEFSVEELPEFQDDDGGIIPASPEEPEQPSGTNAAIPIVIAACAVAAGGAVTAVTVIRKKRDPSRDESGETK